MRHDKRVKNYWNRALKKLFKELSSKRFSISVFIFEKHCTALFNFGKDHLGSVTNWVRRKCNFSVICFGMRRPSGKPQPSLQALSLFPCCYGNVNLSPERKTGLFKRNTARKGSHRTHQLKRRCKKSYVFHY